MADIPKAPDLHPIQLTFITVREITFLSFRPPNPKEAPCDTRIQLQRQIGEFNSEKKSIQVTLRAMFGNEVDSDSGPPFFLRVAMTAEFKADDKLSVDVIKAWADKASTYVILPYLREKLFSISVLGGYPPVNLPLLQIPTQLPKLVAE